MKSTHDIGSEGEEIAVKFLLSKDYRIVERNFYFGKLGEIDIIAYDQDELVFLEVKYSKNLKYGFPESRVTTQKKKKLRKAAEGWMMKNDVYDQPCRIDVIAILSQNGKQDIEHFVNAI